MAVNDIYRVELFWNIGSELTQNVFHLREVVASTDPIPAQAVASAVVNEWNQNYNTALFSPDAFGTLVRVNRIRPTAGVPGIRILGATEIVGAGIGHPVPAQTALLVSLYSDTFTRRGRGRIYVPGVAEEAQNDGQLDAGALNLAAPFGSMFEDPWIPIAPFDGEWEAVVWSRADLAAYKVTQTVAHSNLATQRGRRNFPGIGA